MAGDGVYDVLGFGYDITEDYLGENSTRLQVIDVKALIRDNGDRFYNPFIGTIDQKIVAGEEAQSFLQNVITDSNFKGSVAAMDIKKDAEGFFSGTLSAGFKSASKYSYSSKYSFAKAEVTKKQRKYFVDADVELLSRYLSSNFVSDLGKYSADQIVAKYGTHVLTNITVGGSYIAYYKSAIIEENTGTEKKQTVSAGAKYNMSKVGLDFDGTWSTTTITEANKKNSDWTCTIQCVGGTTSGTTITLAPNQGPTTTINIFQTPIQNIHRSAGKRIVCPAHPVSYGEITFRIAGRYPEYPGQPAPEYRSRSADGDGCGNSHNVTRTDRRCKRRRQRRIRCYLILFLILRSGQ